MTDPLSVSASVSGLAMLAESVIKQTISAIQTYHEASAQLQELRYSVAVFYGYLGSLRLMLDGQHDVPAPLSIFACNHTLEKIKGILDDFDTKATNPVSASRAQPPKHGRWRDVKQKAQWVLKKDKLENLLAELEKHKSFLSLALSKKSFTSIIEVMRKQDEVLQDMVEIRKEQSRMRQQQIQDTERRLSKERRKMLSAISQMKPDDSFKKHFSLHQDGTGVWFLESSEFEKFMSTPNSKLWLYGIPGAGKSVLSATIIDHISRKRSERVALAFFFCEYFEKATQSCRNILGSIARQLALQNSIAFEALEKFFNETTEYHQLDFDPEDDELLDIVVNMSINFDTTIIVIDGLDECQDDRGAIVECLAKMSLNGTGSIKTLFASRKEADINKCLALFDNLAIAASKADVRLHVAAQLKSRFRDLCEKDPAFSNQILHVLVDKSEGMFQWVRCQLDCLANLASNKQRRKALENLPRDLHGTYERILERATRVSEQATIEFVERTLRWIALARRPLSVSEIAHAISVEVEDRSFDDSLNMEMILDLCSSLVREQNGCLVFSHFSVKEYLMQISPNQGKVSRFRISEADHSTLAQVCLTYLLLEDFDRQGHVVLDDLISADDQDGGIKWRENVYPRYPFYWSAALLWMDHAEACNPDDAISTLKQDLFHPRKTDQFLFWAHLWLSRTFAIQGNIGDFSQKMYDITPLHLACIYRSTILVDVLICHGANTNGISAALGTPLQCAISGWVNCSDRWNPGKDARYQTVCRLLREKVSRDQSRYDPVADALAVGDEKVAHVLLEHGFILTRAAMTKLDPEAAPRYLLSTDLTSLDGNIDFPLKKMFANLKPLQSWKSAQKVHRSEFPPVHRTQDYMEAIRESCSLGRLDNVKNLFPGVQHLNSNRLSEFLSRCLVETAAHGHAEVVQFLLEANADPGYQRYLDGRTALHEASSGCHVDVVRAFLKANGVKEPICGIQDNDGLTPWMCAIKAGSVEALQLFLTGPCTINLQAATNNGQTAAHLAASACNEQMIPYLGENGVDFTCLDALGKAPIHALVEPYCGLLYTDSESFESARRMFRYLQQDDMLSRQLKSGQTLLHLIAQLDPSNGAVLWQDIRDNQVFDSTRCHALTITDSEGNTPLHVLVQQSTAYLKNFASEASLLDDFIEFIQLLSTGDDDESEQLHTKNKSGRTPAMEFARSIKDIEIPYYKKETFSDHILKTFRILGDTRTGRCPFEGADKSNCTVLHYIAASRTHFPFKEITEYILERAVDVDVKDSAGEIALMRAARGSQENVDFMRLLIPYMIVSQSEEENSAGRSILHVFCASKKTGIQELIDDFLLQQIAKSEKKSRSGRIPLTYAPYILTDHSIASRLIQFAEKTIDISDNCGKNCMHWSCELGSIAMISALLDAGVNIDAPLGNGDPPLLIAARLKELDVVDYLLEKGADPLVKGKGYWQLHHIAFKSSEHNPLRTKLKKLIGFDYQAKATLWMSFTHRGNMVNHLVEDSTPMHVAVTNGDEQGVQWLLDERKISDTNAETRDGSSPLILASMQGNIGMCKKLIALGNPILKARHDGRTALHVACQYGHLEICRLLISTDNSCVFQRFGEQTALEIAAENGYKDIVELLLEHEAQATVKAEMSAREASHHDIAELLRCKLSTGNDISTGNNVFQLDDMRLKAACEASSQSTLVEVLQKDINPNIRLPDDHETPLHLACREGWKEAVELLVERNANIEALGSDGDSPLLIAVRSKQWECTELLCRKGAQIFTRNKYGWTVLHEASDQNDLTSLSHFLKQGLEANVKTYLGYTPLHFSSDPDCADLLLGHGADPFILGPEDETVTWRYCYYEDGAELLRRIFNSQPSEKVLQTIETFNYLENSTPLYRSAFLGNSDVVSTLIEYGANVNGRCGPLGAPLHAALKQGHVEIATTLLGNGSRPYRIVRDGEENAGWFWEYGYEFCLQGRNGVWVSRSL